MNTIRKIIATRLIWFCLGLVTGVVLLGLAIFG